MNRDYARRQPIRTRRKKSESYFGLWIFTIIIFISFTLGLVYLGKNRQHEYKSSVLSAKVEAKNDVDVNKVTNTTEQQKPKLQFDFDMPKKAENQAVIEEEEAPPPPADKPAILAETKYALDVAKAKNYAAVDKLKAQLALLGFEARVMPIKEKDIYYYKVFVGFYDKKTALKKQQFLKQNSLSTSMRVVDGELN